MSLPEPFGLTILIICVVSSIIALVAPYWLEREDIITGRHHMGLLASCDENSCIWIFEDQMRLLKHIPDWFIATRGLMIVGVVIGILALLVATLALCYKCNPNNAVASFLIVGSLCMGNSVVVFGIKAFEERKDNLKWDFDSLVRFSWSYWAATVATGLSFVTAVLYCCINRVNA